MKYPKWLPYPKAWGQAIVLFITASILVFALVFIITWLITSANPDTSVHTEASKLYIPRPIIPHHHHDYYHHTHTTSEPLTLGDILLMIIVLFPLLMIVYYFSMVQQLIWDKRLKEVPFWLPRRRCWGEGLWNFIVVIFSIMFASIISSIFFFYEENEASNFQVLFFGMSIITTMAYCFHFRNLIFTKYKKAVTPEKSSPERKIDPIEQELNQMKGNLGIKKMNDVNKYD